MKAGQPRLWVEAGFTVMVRFALYVATLVTHVADSVGSFMPDS